MVIIHLTTFYFLVTFHMKSNPLYSLGQINAEKTNRKTVEVDQLKIDDPTTSLKACF